MKNNEYVLLKMATVIFVCLLLPACWESQKKEEKRTGLVVVNVLDEAAYTDCHIKDSINVPFEQIDRCVYEIDKDADVVLYCSNYMCATSEYAGKKLQERGFKKVSVYEGGMAEWYQNGLPIEGSSNNSYLSKRIDKIEHDQQAAIPIITVEELANKMGIKDKAA